MDKSLIDFLKTIKKGLDKFIEDASFDVKNVDLSGTLGINIKTYERLEDAKNKSFKFIDNIIKSDFDNHPLFNFSKYLIDGNEFIKVPKGYVKVVGDNIYVSDKELDGFDLHPAFVDGDKILDGFYIGKYCMGDEDDKALSKPNKKHLVNKTLAEFRKIANKDGYDLFNAYQYSYLQLLFLIEFATIDSRAIFKGVTDRNWNEGGLDTGSSNLKGLESGTNPNNSAFCYRGIENLFGNYFQVLDGFYGTEDGFYLTNSQFTKTKSHYKLVYPSGDNKGDDVSGRVSKVSYVDGILVATEFNGDSDKTYTYLSFEDYEKILIVGGGWSNGSDAGLWSWSVGFGLGDANFHVGSRLSKRPN